MGSRNYACYGWMMPATFENAKKLGITPEEIKEKVGDYDTNEPSQDWWDEAIDEVAMDSTEFHGKIRNRMFSIDLIYIGSEDEIDDDMDDGTNSYFAFNFNEIFERTGLYDVLEDAGMKHHSWVTFG